MANQATVTQSLPSFAQAFSSHSLASIAPASNALPPIRALDDTPRKRSHTDDEYCSQPSRVKEESPAPPPSALRPSPNKRRRVTISGAPHPLNTDVPTPADHTNSTPISPVVMGLTITRDNPTAIEKVKSMISVKQKQKALIEQRRGSVVAVMSPTVTPDPRPHHRSPRRLPNPSPRPPSPAPPPNHSLPPPPISFARRRAEQLGSTKKKPADILISPREAQTQDQFQPAIQSAPPVPHAFGRFPMALPRLPSVLGGPDTNVRRVATAVPPTPTRLSMQRTATVPAQPTSTSQRSPPAASVPIASTLVPPTPGLFHRPDDKAAFLAPFEIFYDALNDSKQLKTWLGEQLQRSNAMIQALTQQQEKLNEVVESLVEKQVAPMRQEMAGLQRRVEELEDALRSATAGAKHKGSKTPLRNGTTNSPMPTDSYTFPPTASLEPSLSSRRRTESSPSWRPDRDMPMIIADEAESPAFEPPRRIESARSLPRLSPRVPTSSPKMKAPASSERPSLSRQASGHGEREGQQSRRNSVIMSPPDASAGDG